MSMGPDTLGAIQGYRVARAALALLSSAVLSSCGVLLGNTVKGSFVCRAPGGTCAPSTLIDDQALALIKSARPDAPASQRSVDLSQAKTRVAQPRPTRSSSAADLARVSNNLVHRDTRTLRLVFPAYVDDAGNLHEARVVHTVVDQGGWIELTHGSMGPRAGTLPEEREASPASPAPHPSEKSLSDKSFAVPSSDQHLAPASPQSPPPNRPLTIDAIRAQVAKRLAATLKPGQPRVQSQATVSHQAALAPSPVGNKSKLAAPVSATPGMSAAKNPPVAFSVPAEE